MSITETVTLPFGDPFAHYSTTMPTETWLAETTLDLGDYDNARFAASFGALVKAGAGGGNFNPLGQTPRIWYGMTTLGSNVYASVSSPGEIYMQTGGTGPFNALGQAALNYRGMTAANGNVYACVYGGDIYMQTGGAGAFVALSQTSRLWRAMATLGTDVYATVYAGDIYKQTGGAGNFVATGQTSRNWNALAKVGSNLYAAEYAGDIYKQTGGAGAFVATGQTSRNWYGLTALGSDVYASVTAGDVYKQTGGTGSFNPLGQPTQTWRNMTTLGTSIYVPVSSGDIYELQTVGPIPTFTVRMGGASGAVDGVPITSIVPGSSPATWTPEIASAARVVSRGPTLFKLTGSSSISGDVVEIYGASLALGFGDTDPVAALSRQGGGQGEDIWAAQAGASVAPEYVVTNAGDWASVSGREAVQQSLIRRFLTKPGDYLVDPTYGAGLLAAVRKKGTRSNLDDISRRLRQQALADNRVRAVSSLTVEPIVGTENGLKYRITIDLVAGGLPMTFGAEIPNG